ncbi:MAG: 16S rRNA (adenine(1518)-N(6)/adenine(1519)-N(6))-dimethyltransferase RsmA [Lachnospiraceae bacterium]|jgi:16S rRNA (adenine1518-N6/adenine1519-N6)-dimethyltransferase|nr:16S rRNA (adenine(1518)-N(6)/adenine(1519)-N(6))-dimethyltransferase RsmA [Lachnospiraceae bacterium]
MPDLTNPTAVLAVLRKHNLALRKKYGQNFLVDRNILEKVVAAANITKDDCVLEIGPGLGTMTALLAERAGRVVAVEIDRLLIPVLAETLAGYDNVTVLNEDIMKTDIDQFGQPPHPLKAVANLPYYITTPVVMKLLEHKPPFSSLTLMVQKEVAARMQAAPGTKDYGALSLAVQYYAKAEVVATVSPSCFIPKPKVESALVSLVPYEKPPVGVADEGQLFAVIRAAFGQRRKTLANALSGLVSDKEAIVNALQMMGLAETIRGEALTLAQFAEISAKIREN